MSSPKQPGAIILQAQEGQTLGGLGVTITYKATGTDTNGQWLVLEYTAPPHFSGPAPHWHKVTTEMFYVLEGTLTFGVAEQTFTVGPGGFAFVLPGVVHSFSNQTDTPAKYLLVTSPAGLEKYFAELADLVKSEPQWPPQDISKVIALMSRYDTFVPPVTG